MGLTLEAEQRLGDVGLISFYEDDEDGWNETVSDTKEFVVSKFPKGSKIRKDDVAKALIPILEVHEGFKDFRNEAKLRAKYWIKDFADLITDRAWDGLEDEDDEDD